MTDRKIIFIHDTPPRTTHQMKQVRVRNGRPQFYESEKVKAAREWFSWHLIKHVPPKPLKGPVELSVIWQWPQRNKIDSKKAKLKITRPDLDNLQKLLKDVMSDLGFWVDDAQVVVETARKQTADVGGLLVMVSALRPETTSILGVLAPEVTP